MGNEIQPGLSTWRVFALWFVSFPFSTLGYWTGQALNMDSGSKHTKWSSGFLFEIPISIILETCMSFQMLSNQKSPRLKRLKWAVRFTQAMQDLFEILVMSCVNRTESLARDRILGKNWQDISGVALRENSCKKKILWKSNSLKKTVPPRTKMTQSCLWKETFKSASSRVLL